LVVVAALAGGGAGFAAARLGDDEAAPAPATGSAEPEATERIRAAVDRVLPNVVLVIADLPVAAGEGGRAVERRNVGSGVVVSQSGHVLTNFHVVDGAERLTVVLASGEQRPARLVGDDWPFSDLAVLSVAPQGLRQVAFGESAALRPGELVLALSGGSGAFGPGNAVAIGVVSGTGRALPRSGYVLEELVQTDAAINSGDSGGALVNLRGEFVGLLTAVVRSTITGVHVEGVAFAQSSDSIRPIVANLVRNGRHPRPRVGIERAGSQHLEVTPELAAERRLPVEAGALVVAPAASSPAARAGVQAGDIVVGVNGAEVTLDAPFVNLLKRLPRGSRVELAVLRAGRVTVVAVTPEE
jgi:2-alkenal reductase